MRRLSASTKSDRSQLEQIEVRHHAPSGLESCRHWDIDRGGRVGLARYSVNSLAWKLAGRHRD